MLLEAPPRSGEARQRGSRLGGGQPRGPARRQRRQRVQHVVAAGHAQLDDGALHRKARPAGGQLEVLGANVAGLDSEGERVARELEAGARHPQRGGLRRTPRRPARDRAGSRRSSGDRARCWSPPRPPARAPETSGRTRRPRSPPTPPCPRRRSCEPSAARPRSRTRDRGRTRAAREPPSTPWSSCRAFPRRRSCASWPRARRAGRRGGAPARRPSERPRARDCPAGWPSTPRPRLRRAGWPRHGRPAARSRPRAGPRGSRTRPRPSPSRARRGRAPPARGRSSRPRRSL